MCAQSKLISGLSEQLDAIDAVRRILTDADVKISLHSIVVVGTQNYGKSSLLSKLTGIRMPTGDGCKTRVPCIFKLRHLRKDANREPHARIEGTDFVLDETFLSKTCADKIENLTGGNPIQNKPLLIELWAASYSDLTLIDLPGLTKLAVGDQPADIEKITKDLMREYAKDEQALLLNVIPADIDAETTDCHTLCKEVDPEGSRTVMVYTKIDNVKNHSFVEKLKGLGSNRVRTKFPCVGVCCDPNREEDTVIASNDVLRNLIEDPSCRLGIPALVQLLLEIQDQRIRTFFPGLSKQLQEAGEKLEMEKHKLPPVFLKPEECYSHYESSWRLFLKKFSGILNDEVPVPREELAVVPAVGDFIRDGCNKQGDAAAEPQKKQKIAQENETGATSTDASEGSKTHGAQKLLSVPRFPTIPEEKTSFTAALRDLIECLKAKFNNRLKDCDGDSFDVRIRACVCSKRGNVLAPFFGPEALRELVREELEEWKQICGCFWDSSREVARIFLHSAMKDAFCDLPAIAHHNCGIIDTNLNDFGLAQKIFLNFQLEAKWNVFTASDTYRSESQKHEEQVQQLQKVQETLQQCRDGKITLNATQLAEQAGKLMNVVLARDNAENDVEELKRSFKVYMRKLSERMVDECADTILTIFRSRLPANVFEWKLPTFEEFCQQGNLAKLMRTSQDVIHKREKMEMQLQSIKEALAKISSSSRAK